ncbi:MAG: NAD-dependent epimerase/dehydratase family protein [Cyclobacteriaceae bacterium]|nr:NAD-dependent epimerase/dehydratase family protein [Cyclobacteriaceae bacterium]
MKVIIMGSTGMVGQGALIECLEDTSIEEVLVINRRATNPSNTKIKEIVHQDFYNFSSLEQELKGYDACFFCLGVSSAGMKEEQYHKLTYDLTMSFAKVLAQASPECTFIYVSGSGTDSTEKGRSMWARVKGKTENDLLKLFKNAYMFRPGYIQPKKGIKSRTPLYNTLYIFFKPLYFLLKPFKGFVTDSVSLGRAMINVVQKGYEKKIIESSDINKLK